MQRNITPLYYWVQLCTGSTLNQRKSLQSAAVPLLLLECILISFWLLLYIEHAIFVPRFPHLLYSIHILSLKIVINHFKYNNPFKNWFYRLKGTPLVMWSQSSDALILLKPVLYGVYINDAARIGEVIIGEWVNSTQSVLPGFRVYP